MATAAATSVSSAASAASEAPKKRKRQALPGSRFDGFWMDPHDLLIIGLDTDDGTEHHLYDKRILWEVDENLVLNIMANGVNVPVDVTKIGGVPYIVDGRQRVRATREANKRLAAKGCEPVRIRAILKKGTASDLFGIVITSNELRRGDTIWGKAIKAQRYMNMGRTLEEAALQFGVTTQTIRNWLSLFELDASVQGAVETGSVPASRAFSWVKLSVEEQKTELETYVASPSETSGEEGSASGSPSAPKPPKANRKRTPTGRPKVPGKSVIRKLITAGAEMGDKAIDAKTLAVLRWAIGEGDLDTVPQIKSILAELETDNAS